VFAGDAIADPLTGLHAALAVLACRTAEGSWVVDLSLRDVASSTTAHGATSGDVVADAPRARSASSPALPLGASTEAVLGELGISPG